MDGCIFCKITKGEIEAAKIYEDEKFFAFLDANPLNPGHTLLIPKQHADYIFDIGEPLYSEIFKMAKFLSKPIQNVAQAKKIGLVVEGFGMPHTHVHIIPLNKGREIDPARAKTANPKELLEIAGKIKKEISKI